MPSFVNRYATPLITGLFLVSLVSGVALFFHIGPSAFHGMHEWLSMVLVVPFVLHIWKNWRPMTGYLRRAPMGIALALSVAAAAAFFVPTGQSEGRSGPPQFQLASAVMSAPVETVAPIFGATADGAVAQLQAAGFDGAKTGATLSEIAAGSGKSAGEIAAAVLYLASPEAAYVTGATLHVNGGMAML